MKKKKDLQISFKKWFKESEKTVTKHRFPSFMNSTGFELLVDKCVLMREGISQRTDFNKHFASQLESTNTNLSFLKYNSK